VSAEERVAKLGALLARITERATAPRKPNGLETSAHEAAPATPVPDAVAEPVTKEVVLSNAIALSADEPFAAGRDEHAAHGAEVEVTEVEVEDEEALAAVEAAEATQAAEAARVDELPSRERMVAASPVSMARAGQPASSHAGEDELKEAERPPTVETGERLAAKARLDADVEEPDTETPPDVAISAQGEAAEEPPASSRRPIAIEPKLEELAFGEAPSEEPHAPPPESGRQVAAPPVELDFEAEFTGVRPRDSEPASAPVGKKSERPAARAARIDASAPEVTAASVTAVGRPPVFEGTAPTFKPSSFGELLDATLSL
jgi:hypothetical protein